MTRVEEGKWCRSCGSTDHYAVRCPEMAKALCGVAVPNVPNSVPNRARVDEWYLPSGVEEGGGEVGVANKTQG